MTVFQIFLLGLYVPLACCLAMYGIHRTHMLVAYLRRRKRHPVPRGELRRLPRVLIQVPVFNERTVVEGVLKSLERLDYPRGLLRVQVLDDSTDDTTEIADRACAALRARGLEATHIRRPSREGFKAGALANGLQADDSELVAIFDADFRPTPDFLRQVVPYFADPQVGLVQARWEHNNLDRNLLTKLQGFFLDGHFIIEHTYRHRTGRYFNFNGTAGVWRRACIDDAGGWSSSSITEDTEISFRAQIRGWQFVYLRDLKVPAEIPADVDAYKSQQHRWAKGYTEILVQHAGLIWGSRIPLKAKIEAMLMLSNHFAFLFMGALTILHLPLVLVRSDFYATPFQRILDLVSINLVGVAFFAFYLQSQWDAGRFTLRRLVLLPLAIGLGMALMVNSCRAVLEALFGIKTEFVRTPKEGERPARTYKAVKAIGQAFVEVAFGFYLLISCVILVSRGHVLGLWINVVVSAGFLFLGLSTLKNHWSRPRIAAAPAPSPAPAAPPPPSFAAQ